MQSANQRGTDTTPLTWSLITRGDQSVIVPLGLPNRRGKRGNAHFHFNYSIKQPVPGGLKFEVSTSSGKLLYHQTIAPEFTVPGAYEICWDGFDLQDVFDSTVFRQPLEAKLLAYHGTNTISSSLHFTCHDAQVNWVDILIDRKSKRIDALLRTNFRDGGETRNDKRSRTYPALLRLAEEGLVYHWGRNPGHRVAKRVTALPDGPYSFYLKAENHSTNGIKSPKIVYQTNARSRRSRNWELSRILFYNTGALKHGSTWYHKSDKKADADFKQIAAHEIGHEILLAFGGHIHSKSHKGSSTMLTQRPLGNYTYPKEGEIDLMIYYQENAECPYPADYNERSVASENDVLSLVWLSQLKVALLSDRTVSG